MARRNWRTNRLALAGGALALLAATPAVLTAAGVKNRWALAGATAAAAVIVVFAGIWQERCRRIMQRRDEQEFATQGGCLVLADGRLPAICDITDHQMLGVHQAAGRGAPAYVPRDVDEGLQERLAKGEFVLLVGDSTAGKTRAAFEAVSSTLAHHVLICPSARDGVAVAVERAAQERCCVLWLDGLERYLGAGGLTPEQVGRLLAGEGHHRVIVATIRTAERARLTGDGDGDDAGQQHSDDIRRVFDLSHTVRLGRMFSCAELERAKSRAWDPRIAEAISHADSYGIAEYLAAGPELLQVWEDARTSCVGPNARGAALVAAAIDVRRAGYTSPIPRELLNQIHEHYLADPEHAHAPREPLLAAWAWATCLREATAALLRPVGSDLIEVFDYLVDTIQLRAGPLGQVPDLVVKTAIDFCDQADADSLADTAYVQGRYALAKHGWRREFNIRAGSPAFGPDHPDTLASHSNLALVLGDLGQLEEAEAETRAVLEGMLRVLGPEHRNTLACRGNLAGILRQRGRLTEAEAEHRAVLEARTRVFGNGDPSILTSRNNLAIVLRELGRLKEAEAEHRAELEACSRLLGADHPDTLTSRGNLARVLSDLGRLPEAEAESRAVLEASTRLLGSKHPDTLSSRDSSAMILRKFGRLKQAEAEMRGVVEARTQELGPDHLDTLTSRDNLAVIMRELGQLEEAEAEHSAVLKARTELLGPDHPHTLASRSNHAKVLRKFGRLEQAEAEMRAVVEARTQLLGPEHPRTLAGRHNLAIIRRGRGQLEQAEAEMRAVLGARTQVLGPDHPDTLTSRGNLAGIRRKMGHREEAEAETQTVLKARTQQLGPEHPYTLTSRDCLAGIMYEHGRLREAEAEMGAVVETRTQVLGPDHPDTLASCNTYAEIVRALARQQGDQDP